MVDGPDSGSAPEAVTSNPTSSKARRGLRKSCHFCRARKIRCSGETICDACKGRNLECSYNEGEPKGRPKNAGPDGQAKRERISRTKSADLGFDQFDCLVTDSFTTSVNQQALTSCSSSISGHVKHTQFEWQDADSIAAQLSNTFSWTSASFRQVAGKPTTSSEQKVSMISDHIARHGNTLVDISYNGCAGQRLSYEDIFFTISQELIELLALRLGEIGCSRIDQDRSHFFVRSFMVESCTSMFDTPVDSDSSPNTSTEAEQATIDPFMGYDTQAIPQLVEMWFSQHPFSFLISKTLLLREIRQERYDPILLAVMIADVQSTGDSFATHGRTTSLYAWVFSRLGKKNKSDVQLSTIQAVVLLGWHTLCIGQARRALVFLAWADDQIRSISMSDKGINIVNGVDISAIEAETSKNTQWLLYSILLWLSMQTRTSTRDLLPWDAPASLPIAEANGLAMLQLDHASGWFSTLTIQEAAYEELWMLSYISAFVSQIYKICPRALPLLSEAGLDKFDWRSDLWRRLRGLSDPVEDNVLICTQVRHLLHELILTSPLQCTEDSDARALELSVVHTILIHLLLPASLSSDARSRNILAQPFEMDPGGGRRILAAGGIDKLTDAYYNSACALFRLFTALQQKHVVSRAPSRIAMSQRRSTKGYIILLGLDACVRGLYSLWSLSRFGNDFERQYLATRQPELQALAADWHSFARPLHCSDGPRLSAIVEKLEAVMCYFCGVETEDYATSRDSSSYSSIENRTRSRTPLLLPQQQQQQPAEMALDTSLFQHMPTFDPTLVMDFITQHGDQVGDMLL